MEYQVRRNGGYVILENAVRGPIDDNGNEVFGSQLFDIMGGGELRIPLVRRLLGDEYVLMIQVRRDGEVDAVKRLFPECHVTVDNWSDSLLPANLISD